jgi:hypothetical protein
MKCPFCGFANDKFVNWREIKEADLHPAAARCRRGSTRLMGASTKFGHSGEERRTARRNLIAKVQTVLLGPAAAVPIQQTGQIS